MSGNNYNKDCLISDHTSLTRGDINKPSPVHHSTPTFILHQGSPSIDINASVARLIRSFETEIKPGFDQIWLSARIFQKGYPTSVRLWELIKEYVTDLRAGPKEKPTRYGMRGFSNKRRIGVSGPNPHGWYVFTFTPSPERLDMLYSIMGDRRIARRHELNLQQAEMFWDALLTPEEEPYRYDILHRLFVMLRPKNNSARSRLIVGPEEKTRDGCINGVATLYFNGRHWRGKIYAKRLLDRHWHIRIEVSLSGKALNRRKEQLGLVYPLPTDPKDNEAKHRCYFDLDCLRQPPCAKFSDFFTFADWEPWEARMEKIAKAWLEKGSRISKNNARRYRENRAFVLHFVNAAYRQAGTYMDKRHAAKRVARVIGNKRLAESAPPSV